MRNSITQLDNFGCGIACVALVMNKSYSDAALMLGKEQAAIKGFTCKELLSVLLHNGLVYSFKYIKPRLRYRIYKEGVIVFVKRDKRYPYGHYLVRHRANGWTLG